jgi:hypothetical protein
MTAEHPEIAPDLQIPHIIFQPQDAHYENERSHANAVNRTPVISDALGSGLRDFCPSRAYHAH